MIIKIYMVIIVLLWGCVIGIWCLLSYLVLVIIYFLRCKICIEIVLNWMFKVFDSWVNNRKVIIFWVLIDGGKLLMDVKIVCIYLDGFMESIGDFS